MITSSIESPKACQASRFKGDPSSRQISITKETMDRILSFVSKGADCGDMIALWMFYAYTARWQNTNQPKATTGYAAKGLGWSEKRVKKVKGFLKSLELVEDVRRVDKFGTTTGWFIQVFYLAKTHPVDFAPGGIGPDKLFVTDTGNALGDYSTKVTRISGEIPVGGSDGGKVSASKPKKVPVPVAAPVAPPRALSSRPPRQPRTLRIPYQDEFDSYLESAGLEKVIDYRPYLLDEMKAGGWVDVHGKPIHSWKAYVAGLDAKIAETFERR